MEIRDHISRIQLSFQPVEPGSISNLFRVVSAAFSLSLFSIYPYSYSARLALRLFSDLWTVLPLTCREFLRVSCAVTATVGLHDLRFRSLFSRSFGRCVISYTCCRCKRRTLRWFRCVPFSCLSFSGNVMNMIFWGGFELGFLFFFILLVSIFFLFLFFVSVYFSSFSFFFFFFPSYFIFIFILCF